MSVAVLVACIERDGDGIVERVLADTYRDPFWEARYGVRAVKHGREDGRFHCAYLVQALVADDPGIMARYARWVQAVLTTRGMCTRHLEEHFERLADAVLLAAWPEADRAAAMLGAAAAALRYEAGPARVLQDDAVALGAGVAAVVATRRPAWSAAVHAGIAADARVLLSYAADALAAGDARTFTEHVAWLAPFLRQQGRPADYLDALLGALAEAPVAPRELGDLVASARRTARV